MTNRPIVLVVDDRLLDRLLLDAVLSPEGVDVVTVSSPLRVVEIAEANLPSLIILDLEMPEKNGFEVCESLREHEATKDIPIMFISASERRSDVERAAMYGCFDYIQKPYDAEHLVGRVKECVCRGRRSDD